MKKQRIVRFGTLLISASALSLGMPAKAQDVSSSESDGPNTNEIIVTAQKRSQSINDVAATISAVSGEQLQDAGAVEFRDLEALSTNVNIQGAYGGGGSNPNITIRGVGLSDFNDNNSSPAGVYVDEVYLVSPTMLSFGLFDLERVEVLKGPQGTLYGRNTTAGALNFHSRKPTGELSAQAQVSYEQFDRVTMQGGVGGPLSDTFGLRVAATGDFGGGYMLNRVSGKKENDRNNWAARAVAKWEPSADLTVLTIVHLGRDKSELGHYQHGALLDPVTGQICADALAGKLLNNSCVDIAGYSDTDNNRSQGDYNLRPVTRYNSFGTSTRIDWNLGGVDLTSVTAYEELDGFRVDESDGSPNVMVETRYAVNVKQFSQELRLALNFGRLDLIVGGYAGRDTIRGNNDYDILGVFRPTFATLPGVPLSGFLPLGVDPSGAFAARLNSSFRQRTTALAAFAHGIWEISPGLKFQAGLRYTDEEKSFKTRTIYEESAADLAAFGLSADGIIIDLPTDGATLGIPGKKSFNRLSWTTGLSYEPNNDLLFYGTVSSGFKSGGFNGGLILNAVEGTPYEQENLTAYEVGSKLSLFDRSVQLNGSFFYYDYADLQVFQLVNTGGVPVQILTNAADAEIYGLDAEANIMLSDRLELRFGIGALSDKFKNAILSGIDRSGDRLVGSPRFSFTGGMHYTVSLPSVGSLKAQLLARYQSSEIYENFEIQDAAGNPDVLPLKQKGYWTVDPRISIETFDGRWEFAIFAKNLFNVRPIAGALNLSDFGFAEVFVGPPRRIGASLSFSF